MNAIYLAALYAALVALIYGSAAAYAVCLPLSTEGAEWWRFPTCLLAGLSHVAAWVALAAVTQGVIKGVRA
jgi:flagellar motor component MotA